MKQPRRVPLDRHRDTTRIFGKVLRKEGRGLLVMLSMLTLPLLAQPDRQHGPFTMPPANHYEVQVFRAGRSFPFETFRTADAVSVAKLLEENPEPLRKPLDYVRIKAILSGRTRFLNYRQLENLAKQNPKAQIEVR